MLALVVIFGSSCGQQEPASEDLYQKVDELHDAVVERAGQQQLIAAIDHSRLAAAEGEVMPPARVAIFSDPAVNTEILRLEPRAGLDLPFRVLAYAEAGLPLVIATPAEFLERRYGLAEGPALQQYRDMMDEVLRDFPAESITTFDVSSVEQGQGVVTLDSAHDFDQTIQQLKDAILAESDTVWFGEVDFQRDAALIEIDLPRLTLLLWGAPSPGAKAMRDFPRMGLDAFCQKTLVYQAPDGSVQVLYNEMPAFAEMHYQDTALVHRVISKRMSKTLGTAVE